MSEKRLSTPEGFVKGTAVNSEQYYVPKFLGPAADQAFKAYEKKKDLDVENAAGGVSNYTGS